MTTIEPCPYGYFRPDKDSECKLKTLGKFKKNDDKKTRFIPLKFKNMLSPEYFKAEFEDKITKYGNDWKLTIYDEDKYKMIQISSGQSDIELLKKPRIKILNKTIKIVENETLDKPVVKDIKIKKLKKKIIIGDVIEKDNLDFDESYLKYLYPRLNDEKKDDDFSRKISKFKEFSNSTFDGSVKSIIEESNKICNEEFELSPHQLFVKNYLSFNTPYNSLLLYHGLGSGKTCSAIGIAEEMRTYMKQVGIKKQIIIVAYPNVQDNFRLQLFDERKLKQENGIWTINSCVGNSLLKEINPTSLQQLTKQKIINQIKNIINQSYLFMGYSAFSNYIQYKISVPSKSGTKSDNQLLRIKKIKMFFDNRLIIIDEAHNMRITNENKNDKAAVLLMELAKYTDNMRLLLLSATPLYNSYEEIIWLTNLMNMNDKRSLIKISDIFDKEGHFKKQKINDERPEDLLKRKLTGYVSYVCGENPYSFPVRIYANNSDYNESFQLELPSIQMNNKILDEKLGKMRDFLFYNEIGEYQEKVYELLMYNMMNHKRELFTKMGNKIELPMFENLDSFGYALLQKPIECLNVVYPNTNFIFDKYPNQKEDIDSLLSQMIGKNGLNECMSYKEVVDKDKPMKFNFDYKHKEKYGKIFSPGEIHKYSSKISNICNIIKESEGIILIYSQFIDGGIIPVALALEEMGFTRYSSESYMKPLLKEPPSQRIDAITMLPENESGDFTPACYTMITGDKNYSPSNDETLKYLNDPLNVNGEKVKVVLISKAGSEGIDFKNIRQVHIMDPWYNMSRIEQIIGRGVRYKSHCMLPFEKRNVEIFLHSTLLKNRENESADMYVYRLSEKKSIKIGKITRLLKEISVDCDLNIEQTNLTMDDLLKNVDNREIPIILSNKREKVINFGHKKHTAICDYMDSCKFKCNESQKTIENELIETNYNEQFIVMNNDIILKRIRELFREIPYGNNGNHFISIDQMLKYINVSKKYPLEQIYHVLNYLINNRENVMDKYGRLGYIINKGEYYIFQPKEITNEDSSILERTMPIDFKEKSITIDLSKIKIREDDKIDNYETILEKMKNNFNIAFSQNTKDDKNWYKIFSSLLPHLTNNYSISLELLKKYVAIHLINSISFSEKILVLNKLYNGSSQNEVEIYIRKYFDNILILDNLGEISGFVFSENQIEIPKIYIKNTENNFEKAQFSESKVILDSKLYVEKYVINKNYLNRIMGFYAKNEDDNYNFKIRDLKDSRNKKGARVDQAGTKDILLKLNEIIENSHYTIERIENDNKEKHKNKIVFRSSSQEEPFILNKNQIVVLMEILILYFNDLKKGGKIWFVNYEQILINKLDQYTK